MINEVDIKRTRKSASEVKFKGSASVIVAIDIRKDEHGDESLPK